MGVRWDTVCADMGDGRARARLLTTHDVQGMHGFVIEPRDQLPKVRDQVQRVSGTLWKLRQFWG